MKKTLPLAIIVVILIAVSAVYFFMPRPSTVVVDTATTSATTTAQIPGGNSVMATSTIIGRSVEGRDIVAYHFGTGSREILFAAGIHGGYEWNTVIVANQLIEYLREDPARVPAGERITVIPVINPDGLYKIVGTVGTFTAADVKKSLSETIPGRFNANNVDLGRNFDCEWKPTSKWQTTTVSGGTSAFSEPESQALKSYVETHPITAAVVWYSAVGGVFSSSCNGEVSADTKTLTATYASATGYPAHESFDFYAITGDTVNWLAKNNIAAISVLLTNHTDPEWAKNRAGVDAVLRAYAQ